MIHFQALTQRLYEYQYSFDAAGNRSQMKYYDGSTTQTTYYPVYNEANQLTQRSIGGQAIHYSYDNNGNMTDEHVHDPNFNSLRIFSWNRDNRMTTAENIVDDTVAAYTYDALGRRIMRWDPYVDIKTVYYYDGLSVIAEKQKIGSGSWDWQRIFSVGPGVIGNIFRISEKSGSNWVDIYYHYDAIGNVALRTNSSGIVEAIDQEAYGNVKVGAQSGYHLTTKEYDSISELYYFNARWYDNNIGHFNSKDPLPNIKPYLFCINNPNLYIDPNGLEDTLTMCRTSSSKELIFDTGWYFFKRIIKWDISSIDGGAESVYCFCHLIARNWRNIYARLLTWKITTETICNLGGECENRVVRSNDERYEHKRLERYIDVPMQHPMRTVVLGIKGEGGCLCFMPSD